MDCEENLDRSRRIGPDTQQMGRNSEIRSTDIMLGRGPAFYNNPGNMVFRKLLKEHAVRYRHEVSRREKTEMVSLLVSQLEAKGCRFLHLSSTGNWVEASSRMIVKKVGHGLRDARLAVAKNGGTVTVIPENFRPSVNDPQCHATPSTLQKSHKHLMASSSISAVHLMQGWNMMNSVPIPETGQHHIDAYKFSFPPELSGIASQKSLLVEEEEREKAGLSFVDRQIAEIFAQRDSAGNIISITEPSLAHPSSTFDFEIEGGLVVEHHSERSEGCRCDMDYILGLRNVFPRSAACDVDMVLKVDAGLGCDVSFDDCLDEYQSQSVGCADHDGQSLCRWFRNLS